MLTPGVQSICPTLLDRATVLRSTLVVWSTSPYTGVAEAIEKALRKFIALPHLNLVGVERDGSRTW